MCSGTPRFSYDGPKLAVTALAPVLCMARTDRGWVLGGYRGRVYGWVPGRAIPGTTQPHCCEEVPRSRQRSGPRKPHRGLEWVVCGHRGLRWAGRLLGPPCGPGQAMLALPVPGPSECPPTAKGARFHLISHKVSQNREVSAKYVDKASHSPCFQNRLQKSPLQFLRFPFSSAFSPKELMGLF